MKRGGSSRRPSEPARGADTAPSTSDTAILLAPRPDAAGITDDPSYNAAFEAERARVLRRRIAWSIYVLLTLLAFSVFGTFIEYNEYRDGIRTTPLELVILGAVDDLMLGSVLIATLLYVLKGRPDRRKLVGTISRSTVAMMTGATIIEIERVLIQTTDWMGKPMVGVDPRVVACQWALMVHVVFVFVPLMLVPMHWRESRRIAFACWAAFVALTAAVATAPLQAVVLYSLLALAVSVPPIAFSHWRYQRFDAQFQHNELKGRFGEISAELSQARRLHEALFPRPLDSGLVRVRFSYEPMREIGGDFLFMQVARGAAEGSPAAVFVALIDVSGHGIASALAVNRLHGELVRMCAAATQSHEALSAEQMLANLNAYVCFTLAPQAMFATALCIKVEPEADGRSASLTWASAGHPPALLLSHLGKHDEADSSDAPGALHRLEATATMLGVLEPADFVPGGKRITILPGDTLIAYTDGVQEARPHAGGELGLATIEAIARRHLSDRSLAEVLVHTAAKHRAGHVTDDMLVVEIGLHRDDTAVGGERLK